MATADLTFETIPAEMRENLKRVSNRSDKENPLVNEFMKGETLWIEEPDANKLAGLYNQARTRGQRMTLRKVSREIDGKNVIGHIAWWTPEESAETVGA